MMSGKLDAVDMIINVLKEHEKELDESVHNLKQMEMDLSSAIQEHEIFLDEFQKELEEDLGELGNKIEKLSLELQKANQRG